MRIILCITLICFYLSLNAQTGPAGIGDDTTNGLWLRADKLELSDGDIVNNWNDVSGNANNAGQTDNTEAPVFVESSSINGQPTVRFDGGDQMQIADDPILDGSEGITYYAVIRPTNLNGNARGILGKRITFSNSSNYSYTWFFWSQDRLFNDIVTNNNRYNTGTTTYSNNTNYMLSWNFDGTLPQAQRSEMREGSEVVVTSGETSTSIIDGDAPLTLGALNQDYNTYLAADYAEIIQYNYAFDDVDHILMQNYLSAKYAIPLVSNDLYDEDDNGDYDFEVVGLGQLAGGQVNDDAQGCGILRINNPSDLNDNEFFIFGHDNQTAAANETADVPASVEARFDRVWRASEVNNNGIPTDVGELDLSFDLSNFESVSADDLVLLVDSNNDGSFADETPISGAIDQGSGVFTFAGVTQIEDSFRFTIGTTNVTDTPLPIKLRYFNATVTSDAEVLLEWVTESEVDNEYFTIERSFDGIQWQIITDDIPGAGTSSSLLYYSYIDYSVNSGIYYYRLKQTDFSDDYTYSDVVRVEVYSTENKVYPNPAIDYIIITGVENSDAIQLFNIEGVRIPILSETHSVNGDLKINIQALSKGLYFIKTEQKTIRFIKQ